MDVFEAIRMRRSIKPEQMSPEPLDDATLLQLLEAANWAPSHGRTEPWRFVVFTGEARQAAAAALLRTMSTKDEVIAPDDPRRLKIENKAKTAPVMLAIVCEPSTNPKILEHEELISTGIAVHNMHLAACALGLGAYWSSGARIADPSLAEFLGIKAPARCLGFFYVGRPAIDWPKGHRRPIEEKIRWHRV